MSNRTTLSSRSPRGISLGGLALALLAVSALPLAGMQEEDERHSPDLRIAGAGGDDIGDRAGRRALFIAADADTVDSETAGDDVVLIDEEAAGKETRHLRVRRRGAAMAGGGFLGVMTSPMTRELREHLGAPADAGVLVSKVVEDSAAFRAGLLVGDIITAVEGEPVTEPGGLLHAILPREAGESVTLDVYRNGKVQSLTALLGEAQGPRRTFAWGPHHRALRRIELDCAEDDADCDLVLSRHGVLCDGDEECDIRVSCEDGDCSCTLNGSAVACDELGGFRVLHDD